MADKASVSKVYRHEDGYPDLLSRTSEGKVTDAKGKVTTIQYYAPIAAASGQIKNVDLGEHGAVLFRAFGPAGSTHGVEVGASKPASFWWVMGETPKQLSNGGSTMRCSTNETATA